MGMLQEGRIDVHFFKRWVVEAAHDRLIDLATGDLQQQCPCFWPISIAAGVEATEAGAVIVRTAKHFLAVSASKDVHWIDDDAIAEVGPEPRERALPVRPDCGDHFDVELSMVDIPLDGLS